MPKYKITLDTTKIEMEDSGIADHKIYMFGIVTTTTQAPVTSTTTYNLTTTTTHNSTTTTTIT